MKNQVKEGYFTYEEAKQILGECSLTTITTYREVYGTLNYGYAKGYGYKAVSETRRVWQSLKGDYWVLAK